MSTRCAFFSGTGLSTMYMLLMLILHVQPRAAALDTQEDHFGIGFDLTAAYGTAAVSFANGSKVPLARVDGDASWRELMCNLPVDSNLQRSCSTPRATANSTVDTIAKMLISLRTAAEHRFGQPITTAAATMPGAHQTRLSVPLIEEAFRLADIDYLHIVHHAYTGHAVLYPEDSVLASHDLGLCQPYTSPQSCLSRDNPDLAPESYYYVGYYDNEIEVTTTSEVRSVYAIDAYPYSNFFLGADMRHNNPDESYYWEEVRKFLSRPLVDFSWHVPSRVILYGDRSDDIRLRETVEEVLKALLTKEEMPKWVDDDIDATFAGAMGAAEFAKRKPYWDPDGRSVAQKVMEPKPDL